MKLKIITIHQKEKEGELILDLDIDKDEAARQNKILMEKNGQHFVHAIKAGDTYEIISIVNSTKSPFNPIKSLIFCIV